MIPREDVAGLADGVDGVQHPLLPLLRPDKDVND